MNRPFEKRVDRRVRMGSYTVLLIALVGYIFVFSAVQEGGVSAPWITRVLFPVILFTTLGSAVTSRRSLIALIGMFIAFVVIDVLAANAGGTTPTAWSHAGHAVFLLCCVYVVLRHVFRDAAVSPDMVIGSVCAFLLLALAFNEVFSLVETVNPGSFEGLADVRKDGGYFSLVTLTTLGYGDVVPVKAVARSLAALQAVVGQFYIAVIVARLVAQGMQYSRGSRAAADEA